MATSTGVLYSFDVPSGAFTEIGNVGLPEGLNGMAYDSNGTLYGVDSGNLYTVDVSVPSVTLVGPLGIPEGGIAIAMSIDITTDTGYTFDIVDDLAYSIDLSSGTATLLGPTGFDGNFGQGMFYDPLTDTVFLAAFNGIAFMAELRTLDRTTGTTTLIGEIATAAGPGQLGWSSVLGGPVENFVCEDAINVDLGTTNVEDGIDNTEGGASNVCLSGATDAVWYKYTASNSGDLTISSDLAGSAGVDTRVSVYNDDCSALTCLGSDDNSGTDNTSMLTLTVESGTTYYIEWDDANDEAAFDFELSLDIFCPDPENFMLTEADETTATFTWEEVAEATNGYILSVFEAGVDPNTGTEVYTENVPSGTTTATATGLVGSTNYDAYLTADCDTDGFSNDLMLSFATVPANDNLCDAIDITLDAECTGAIYTNENATVQTDEPEGDCFTGGPQNTVWFSFVAPDNGNVLITTDLDSGVATLTDSEIALYADPSDCADLSTLEPAIACDQDGGNDIIFNSIINTQGLTPGDTYYVQVSGYNGASGTFCIEVQTGPDCPAPENFAVSNITQTTADFNWDPVVNASAGYVLSVFNAGDDPSSDDPVYTEDIASGTTTGIATGLTDTSAYDAYITADCDGGGLSEMTMISFSTLPAPPECGGKFYDTGGPDGSYALNEDYSITITADDPENVVTLEFLTVDIEAGFDFLRIYDGEDASAPELSDPVNGVQAPGSFTSTVPGGSLFITFTSDFAVTGDGWDADVTCSPPLGVNEFNEAGFSYYPNPTTNTVSLRANQPIESIALFNILGQQVIDVRPDATETSLDLSGLSNGTYIMKSTINGSIYTSKVIKE